MFLTFPLIVHKNQESMGFTIDDYYNPSWQIYHQWRRLYIASDATAKNLRALDFAQKKKNKDKEYTTVSIFQIQSPPLRLHAWNKRRLERFLSLWKGKCIVAVAFYSNHQVPSSRSVRLVHFHEWKSDGQCSPIVPGIVTCGFLSVRCWFHPLASARSIFMPMIHAGPRSSCTTRCIFISISRRKTWLRFRWFAPRKWFNIRETSPRRGAAPSYYSNITPPFFLFFQWRTLLWGGNGALGSFRFFPPLFCSSVLFFFVGSISFAERPGRFFFFATNS